MKVGVIDYGVGNLGSVLRALESLRVSPSLIDRPVDLHAMDALILPGVGNFADCVQLLESRGWCEAIREEVLSCARPLLGICVGMQLLATLSTEGAEASPSGHIRGLDLIPGCVGHLRSLGCQLPLPHVGWNAIEPSTSDSGLFHQIPRGTDFYFVHSYSYIPDNASHVLATTEYGVKVTAAVGCGNVMGTQFHPEKSSRAGFSVLRNFIEGR
jgi:glutamine amidotransferase